MKVTMSGGDVPPDKHDLKFIRNEQFTKNVEKYGNAILLIFVICEGQYKGVEVTRVCRDRLSKGSVLLSFVEGLLGRSLQPGEEIELDDLHGTIGTGYVERAPNGGVRVANFTRKTD